MGGMSPYVASVQAFDDYGRGGEIASNTHASGVLPAAYGAQANALTRLQGTRFVDPVSGQIVRQPMTPGEMAQAQSQLEQFASNRSNQNFQQALGMLGGGGSYGGSGMRAPAGSTGGSMSGGALANGTGSWATRTGGAAGPAGNAQQIPWINGQLKGMYQPGGGVPRDPNTGAPMSTYGMSYGTGGVATVPLGGSTRVTGNLYGAGGVGGSGGVNGGVTGQGSGTSTGSQAGGFEVNRDLHGAFSQALMGAIQGPGMDAATQQRIINRGNDALSESQDAALLGMREQANSAGAGGSGGAQSAGERELHSDFAGQRAGNIRNVQIGAETDRLNRMNQALGIAGGYLGNVEDRAAAEARWQAEAARDDRNKLIDLMVNQKTALPSLAGSGQTFGFNFGFGGGANSNTPQGGGAVSQPGPMFNTTIGGVAGSQTGNTAQEQGGGLALRRGVAGTRPIGGIQMAGNTGATQTFNAQGIGSNERGGKGVVGMGTGKKPLFML